jgi:hypothetical protein
VDRGALLKLLSTLVTISTKTRDDAVYAVQLAALRLASHDVQLMKKSLSPVEAMSHALNEFDINMDVFSKEIVAHRGVLVEDVHVDVKFIKGVRPLNKTNNL